LLLARHGWIAVVAVTTARTVAVRVPVSVGVPRHVRAVVGGLGAPVYRAGVPVLARDGLAAAAAFAEDAPLDAVAIRGVRTLRVPRLEVTHAPLGVASIRGAIDPILALRIVEARLAPLTRDP